MRLLFVQNFFYLPFVGQEKLNKRCKSTTLLNWFHVRLSVLIDPATIMTLMIGSHFHLTPHFNTQSKKKHSKISNQVLCSPGEDFETSRCVRTDGRHNLRLRCPWAYWPPTLVCHFAPTQWSDELLRSVVRSSMMI